MKRVYLDNNFLIKLRDSVEFREQFGKLFINSGFSVYTSVDTLIEQVSSNYEQSILNLDYMINVLNILNIKLLPGWYFVSLNNVYYKCFEKEEFNHLVIEPEKLPIDELYKSILALTKQHASDAIQWKINKKKYCIKDNELVSKRNLLILNMILKAKDNNFHKYIPNYNINLLIQSYVEGYGEDNCFQSITSFIVDRSHLLDRKTNITKNDVRDIQQTCFYHYMDVLCLEKNHIRRLREAKIFNGTCYGIRGEQIVLL